MGTGRIVKIKMAENGKIYDKIYTEMGQDGKKARRVKEK
jgi:hypothetical protein